MYLDDSDHGDDACVTHTLPRQTQHQSIELGTAQTQLCSGAAQGPDKFALVQSPRCQPDANAVMHQNLQTVGSSVGKEIGRVRVGRTKHRHNPGQGGVGASAHVHRASGQPDGIDADHLRMTLVHCAKSSTASVGQVMIIETAPLCSSTLMRSLLRGSGVAVAGSLTAMKAATDGDVTSD